nr:FlgO family outer membrane protein [Geobacter hydrogenophilus]
MAGCASNKNNILDSQSANVLPDSDIVKSAYTIADGLLSQLKANIHKDSAIIVTSFVNIDNLKESSTTGRMLAEHVASRLSQRGYKIIEMRLRTSSVFMEEGKGEFLLSRDLQEVSKNQNAAAVVVGTYGAFANGELSVSARIVSPSDSVIISSCDYVLAKIDKPKERVSAW